ncbi:hypothetical protein F7731_21155 [Cytobacillus depressus]|uniref:Uncharacterized protein n=1 Tax=Cytobacillus depressus TaxID=1602942 RepID=A0A6L3V209_9BACI|nr:hypothetical protein [Cytobacillus depressus]KAB2329973.1 hypothetical protein F7731_21155 [Cytobacillus depressus]
MNVMITLLPIAGTIILAMIVVSMIAKGKMITVKVTHWLLIIYVGFLLLSMLFVSVVKKDDITSREKVEDLNEAHDIIYNALNEGKLDQLESRHLISEKTFDYVNNTLNIGITGNDDRIFVERKADDDGKIEARVYTDGLIVGGYDFTDKIIPVQFRLTEDTLDVMHPEHQIIDISVVRKEFTINQFTGQTAINDVSGDARLVVYLKIPKSLQLNGPSADFLYIND